MRCDHTILGFVILPSSLTIVAVHREASGASFNRGARENKASVSEPNQVMCRDFVQQPIRPLLVQPLERVRALDAVVIGARRSYMQRRSLGTQLREQFRRVSLFLE